MIHYPLNHRETRVVRWTSTVIDCRVGGHFGAAGHAGVRGFLG